MATREENKDIGELKTDVAVLKNDVGYIKTDLKKVVDFVDQNKGGITTASLLNNRIVSVVIFAIIAVGIYFIGKGGAGL